MKPVKWIGSSLEDLRAFPHEVQRGIGYALHFAQMELKHKDAKPLKGLGGVMEIVADHATNTYRGVYTAKIKGAIYVLHVFQKKLKHGIKMPQHEIEMIKRRLKEAYRYAEEE